MKDDDHSALRLERLRAAIESLNRRCSELAQEFEAVARFRRSASLRDTGWPIEMVCAVTVLAFLAELFVAILLSENVSTLDPVRRDISAGIVAVCGVGLSALAGEAFHRRRVDRSYGAGRVLSLLAIGAVALAVLVVEWGRHFAAASAAGSRPHGSELDGLTIGAGALIVLLVPGIAFAHRERWSTMSSRHRARALRRSLRAHERRRDDRYEEWIALRSQVRIPVSSVRYDSEAGGVTQPRSSVSGPAVP